MNRRVPTLRARRRQNTQAEVVRAAFQLFARHGYEAVSAQQIAAAAGISRATFFNYFPRKDAILLELARARAARLTELLESFRTSGRPASIAAVIEAVLKVTQENARISFKAKDLLLKVFFAQASRGLLLPAREAVVDALAEILRSLPGRRKADPALVADTVFAIFVATMLEWLMRKNVPQRWLAFTMRARLQMALAGVK